jgi:hypothetical protein
VAFTDAIQTNQPQTTKLKLNQSNQNPRSKHLDVSTEAAILQAISVLYGKLSELKTRVAVAATTT